MIVSFINNILDKCFFTLAFIVGVQLPEFINQYIQRLSGHLNEAKLQLGHFQSLAEKHYQGDITLLITNYKQNTEQSIVDMATVIENLLARVDYLQTHYLALVDHEYLKQLKQFFTHADLLLVNQTAEHFTLAIPLEINALITGITLALLGIVTKNIGLYIVTWLSKKLWSGSRIPQ